MFKNYFKVALRIFTKQKLYTAINIFGLATALAICLMVMGHVSYELSFEDSHQNKERIYRVNGTYRSADTLTYTSRLMSPLGAALKSEIPEIEHAAVFRVLGNIDLKVGAESYISDKEKSVRRGFLHEGNVLCANSDFLDVFTLPLVQGDPDKVLEEPYSVLITDKAAKKFFPDENPMGQMVRFNENLICHITGVLEDIHENTQIYCEFIVSYASLESIGEDTQSWDQTGGVLNYRFGDDFTYLLLTEDAEKSEVETKISGIVGKYFSEKQAPKFSFELQPLKDIYFSTYGSGRNGDLGPHGELSFIIEVSVTVGFILLLAIANFINLSTARSAERMKEVGMRKVMGAKRWHLIKQFLGESILITAISVIVGLILYEIFLKWMGMRELLGREAMVDFYNSPLMIFMVVCLTIVVGIMAGFYPALYLSRFKPFSILQNRMNMKSSKSILRRGLVVFQFTIVVFFICCSIVMYRQVDFMTSMNMGFDKDNVLLLNFRGDKAVENCRLMKNDLEGKSVALAVTAVNSPPGKQSYSNYAFFPTEERKDEEMITARTYFTDYNFFSTFGLEIIRGREFSPDIERDENHSLVINESMVAYLKLDNPIGHKFYRSDGFYEVVGVVKDFFGSTQSYSQNNRAVVILNPEKWKTLAVKIRPDNTKESAASIKQLWETTLPGVYFDYSFLIDEVEAGYGDLKGMTTIFFVLALLAISMGCLGIFGLVAFTAEQKTKEIGIRKVMGASIVSIINMLSKEFVILIIISNAIAWPLAYMLTNDILQYFVARVDVGVGTFLFTGLLALALALSTVGYQAYKAARANPVDTLRYE